MRRKEIVIVVLLIFTSLVLFLAIFSDNCDSLNIAACISGSDMPASTEVDTSRIIVEITSSNTKQDWMDAISANFNAEERTTSTGKVIEIQIFHGTSGGTQQAILEGTSTPTVWSPGDTSWVLAANDIWRDRNGVPLIAGECPQTIFAPIGIAMWRPMAEALGWPDPISMTDLIALAAAEDGWSSIGHPEWGTFKFGHTHPDFSNVGLLSLTSVAYQTLDKVGDATAEEVYGDSVTSAFEQLELSTYHYGIQSRNLLALMATRGPQYLHAVTTSEAETLRTNAEQGERLRFPLVFVFPSEGTFWGEHPYCILDADWVTDAHSEAAEQFLAYLLEQEQQALAPENFLRPVDPTIPLSAPIALDDGTNPQITTTDVPAFAPPSADVANAVRDVFHQTKKPAAIILVLDTSGSMQGNKLRNAAESAANFINRLSSRDQIFVIGFSGSPYPVGEGGIVAEVSETLSGTVQNVISGGGTALYDAVCFAVEKIDELESEHETLGTPHLYGIVLLSDGDDRNSTRSENQMFSCLPSGENIEEVRVYTIAYGDDANQDVLLRIANRTNGKFFTSGEQDIDSIYRAISAEQ